MVTNLDQPAQSLSDERRCTQGETETRIKEWRLDLVRRPRQFQAFFAARLQVLLAGMAKKAGDRHAPT